VIFLSGVKSTVSNPSPLPDPKLQVKFNILLPRGSFTSTDSGIVGAAKENERMQVRGTGDLWQDGGRWHKLIANTYKTSNCVMM